MVPKEPEGGLNSVVDTTGAGAGVVGRVVVGDGNWGRGVVGGLGLGLVPESGWQSVFPGQSQ